MIGQKDMHKQTVTIDELKAPLKQYLFTEDDGGLWILESVYKMEPSLVTPNLKERDVDIGPGMREAFEPDISSFFLIMLR